MMSTLSLCMAGLMVACASDDATAPTPGLVMADANGVDAMQHADAGSEIDSSVPALEPPTGCKEVTLGQIRNGVMFTPPRWGVQTGTTLEATGASPFTSLPNVRFSLSLSQPVPRPSNGQALHLPLGSASLKPDESAHFALYQALDDKNVIHVQMYSQSGTLTLTDVVNDEQVRGDIDNLVLRRVIVSREGNWIPDAQLVEPPYGICLFVRHADFDTRQPGGCDPSVFSSCGAGRTCQAINGGGTDGICVASRGTIADGELCTPDAATGDSDCAEGSVCRAPDQFGDSPTRCLKRCNRVGPAKQCADNFVCGAFGTCMPLGGLFYGAHDLRGQVAIGGDCGQYDSFPHEKTAFCGDEKRLGFCADYDANGPEPSRCLPFSTGRADCK